MPTSVRLRGRSERSLADLGAALVERRDDLLAPRCEHTLDEEARPMLAVRIHPAAEPVRLVASADGSIVAEARTGTAGPGYHQHVCTLLAALPGVRWQDAEDDSGYWSSHDRRALEEATLLGLRTLALEMLALHARGHRGLQLGLPDGITFEHDGVVATPMGPREHGWLERVARAPREGIDALPWWEPGQSARVARDAAIAAMWIDVRWRPPLLAAERDEVLGLVRLLERAHALAPEERWPWREWSELCEHMGDASLAATHAHLRAATAPGRPPIGYRRRPVRVAVGGGWSLRIPGEFAERWDDRGTWIGWDAQRSIWVTTLRAHGSPGTRATLAGLPALPGQGETLAFERGALHAIARFGAAEEDGRALEALYAQAAIGEHAAIGTVVFERDGDRDWALRTWASIAHVEAR